jgi:hypothetical protein
MKFPWFILRGIIFFPITLPGWLILLVALAYAIYNFIRIDRASHSVSDTLSNWGFNLFLVVVAYYIIAYFTSRVAKSEK